jgi:hypothetical protein
MIAFEGPIRVVFTNPAAIVANEAFHAPSSIGSRSRLIVNSILNFNRLNIRTTGLLKQGKYIADQRAKAGRNQPESHRHKADDDHQSHPIPPGFQTFGLSLRYGSRNPRLN